MIFDVDLSRRFQVTRTVTVVVSPHWKLIADLDERAIDKRFFRPEMGS
jgi:hypothetical protein